MAARKERQMTGGGPKTAPDLDDLEMTVVGIIGETSISGVEGGFDLNEILLNQSLSSNEYI